MAFQIRSINRNDTQWTRLTTERYRIDEHTIDELLQKDSDDAGDVATLLPRCDAWIKNVLFNQGSDAPLRITKHLLERVSEYQGKLSRCGAYIELYSHECDIIKQLPQLLNEASLYKIVEIGLNSSKDVCKIALLLPFSQWTRATDKRKLFLLVGCDGGLKTFYAVPNLKWRIAYQMDSQITSLSLGEIESVEAEQRAAEAEQRAAEQKKAEEEEEARKQKEKKEKLQADGWTIFVSRKKK